MKRLTKKSRVTLVEPCPTQFGRLDAGVSQDFYSITRVPPRALPTLNGVLRAEGWKNVSMISPFFHGEKDVFSKDNLSEICGSDAVLVSPILRTSGQAFEIAEMVKVANRDANLIAGGMDASYRVDKYLEHFDAVVVGEGERTVVELMERLTGDYGDLSGIAGLATRDGGFEPKALMSAEEMSELPNPVYDDTIRAKATTGVIEQERGCPYNCPYCLVTLTYGGEIRSISTEKVLSQFDELGNFKKLKSVMFTGDNMAGAPAESMELMGEIKERYGGGGIRKVVQVSSSLAYQPELMRTMRDVNVFYLCVGFESVNDSSLGALGKPFKAKHNTEAAKRFRDMGFWINAMMMIGTDEDDASTVEEVVDWCKEYADSMQLFIVTPFSGTPYYDKMKKEGRILTDKAYLYDAQHCVIEPEKMGAYELQMGMLDGYRDFYSMTSCLKRMGRTADKTFTLGLGAYAMGGGIERILNSPQTVEHLEFLKRQ